MISSMPLVRTQQFIIEATKWFKAIGLRECASVTFIPKTDRIIRLEQLVRDKELIRTLPGREKYIFQFVEFKSPLVENREDLYHLLSGHLNSTGLSPSPLTFPEWVSLAQSKNAALVLIIPEAELLLTPINKPVLSLLSYIYDEFYPTVRILSVYESQILHPINTQFLPASTRLYSNVFSYPLYSRDDTQLFIDILEIMFDTKVSEKIRLTIIDTCGGHWWLVKEAVRQHAAEGRWSSEADGIQYRLRMLFSSFSSVEQTLLKKLSSGKNELTDDEQLSLDYLISMRLLDTDRRITVPLFAEYLTNTIAKPGEVELREGHVLINSVPVDTVFSRKELRVLKLLLEHLGQIISRDRIAAAIWPVNTQKYYSDWAIDQIIKRLRKRLSELSVPGDRIKVMRGKGYVFSLN